MWIMLSWCAVFQAMASEVMISALSPVIVARLLRCRQGRDAGLRTRGQNFANIGYNERLHSQLSPPVEAAEATT